MDEITNDIYKWLVEFDKLEAAKFLKENCNVFSNYVDAYWIDDDLDRDFFIVSIEITISIKKYRERELYKQHIDDIEKCIGEYNQAHDTDAKSIQWTPVLSKLSGEDIPASKVAELTLKDMFKIYTDYTNVIKLLKDNHYIDDRNDIIVWKEKNSKISKQHGLLDHLCTMKYLKDGKLTPEQKVAILKNTFNTDTTINTMERAVDYDKYVKEYFFIPAKK